MEGLPMAQVAILKKYSIKCRKDLDTIVLFWTKTSQRPFSSAYLATDNIHIVLKTITPC